MLLVFLPSQELLRSGAYKAAIQKIPKHRKIIREKLYRIFNEWSTKVSCYCTINCLYLAIKFC